MATAENWLDVLIGLRRFYAAGIELVKRSGINFGTGITAVDNPTTQMTDVTVDLSHVTLAGDVSGTAAAAVVGKIRGVTVSPDAPTEGQFPYYDSETSTLKYLDPPVIYGGTPAQAAARAAFYGETWGTDIHLMPLGTGDESARWVAVANVCADNGWTLRMGPGHWEFATPARVPSELHCMGDLETDIEGTIAISLGYPKNAIFFAEAVATATSTTLAAAATLGSKTISCVASIPNGTIINVQLAATGLVAQTYTVSAAPSGGGPYTITLDRPLEHAWPSGSVVTHMTSVPTGIIFEGNGATIRGTATRFWEIEGGQNCIFRGFKIDASALGDDLVCSWDLAGHNNLYEDIVIWGSYAQNGGLAFESNSNGRFVRCTNRNAGKSGLAVYNSWDIEANSCHISGIVSGSAGVGIYLGEGYAGAPSYRCRAVDCTVVGCFYGIQIDESRNAQISGGSVTGCTGAGVYASKGIVNTLVGVTFDSNYTGLLVGASSDNTMLSGCSFPDSSNCHFQSFGTLGITNCQMLGAPTFAAYINSGDVTISGGSLLKSTKSNGNGIYLMGGTCKVVDSQIKLTTGSGGHGAYVASGAVLSLSRALIDSDGGGDAVYVDAGGKLKTGPDVDVSGTAGYSIVSGGASNFGAAAPGYCAWAVGDECRNSAPSAGNPQGWVCTVAGTPGTWKAMANLV